MEHHSTHNTVLVSMASALTSIITADYQAVISLTAGLVAIVSGCMAIRHYYYATKKIKNENN